MPLQPAILVGVGGSGGKSLRTLRQTLLRRLRAVGWNSHELPAAWQMVAIDTITVNSADGYPEELLPSANYLGLVPKDVAYGQIRDTLLRSVPAPQRQSAFGGWLPREIAIPVEKGAGQNRAVGRTVSAFALGIMRQRLLKAYQDCRTPAALAELVEIQSRLGADEGQNDVVLPIVITSLAGGTGSGMFLDVIEALAAVEPRLGVDAQVILFGPDVFGPILNKDAGAGIAANTLAAVGSITAGVWGTEPSMGTRALYAAHGLDGAKEGDGLLVVGTGTRCNFVIGAVNSNGANVGVMDDAYRAAGDSIAALLTDQKVLDDFQNFFKVNVFMNSWNEAIVGDKSRLTIAQPRYTQPFASFGSAKVSLGLQRFQEYASQAITRSTVERLVWPALEIPDPKDPRTDDSKINDVAEGLWDTVLEESRLSERDDDDAGVHHDDVVNALASSDLEAQAQTWAANLINKAAAGAGNKGLSPEQWQRAIQVLLDVSLQEFLSTTESLRRPLTQAWTDQRKANLPEQFAAIAASRGLGVAASLLDRLREETRFVAGSQLPLQAEQQRRQLAELPGRLGVTLTSAGLASIEPTHPIMAQVRTLLARSALMQEGAARYTSAAELLLDLEENLLSPMREGMVNTRVELLERVKADRLDDGRPNPFNTYPRIGQPAGRQYRPGSTELLLINPDDYPDLLRELTQASLEPEHRADWKERLIASTVRGTTLRGERKERPFLLAEPSWVTRASEARVTGAALPTRAQYESVHKPIDFIDRANAVVEDPDVALGKYLTQPLGDFLSPTDPAERNRRRSDFVARLVQAFNIGMPLVRENQTLMKELHPQRGQDRGSAPLPVVSRIPVDPSDELYSQIRNALSSAKVWDEDRSPKWFGPTTASEIDIFQASPSASSGMALSSLMAPVMQRWMSLRDDPDARRGFWQMKRARPLVETIPVSPEVLEDMIEGWFISGILGQRKVDSPNPDLGWRSQIWDPESQRWIDFPYPLLGTNGGDMEQLPGVLVSLLVAMAECDLKSSLVPLRPYQRLITLGRNLNSPADELREWVRTGSVPQGAPQPPETWAGSSTDSIDSRRDAVRNGLERSLQKYGDHFAEVERSQDPFLTTLAWEIRTQIDAAHNVIGQSLGTMGDGVEEALV
jgi:hypothetical protein